jgi:uncharacterized protein YgiM (DUF1202 family)
VIVTAPSGKTVKLRLNPSQNSTVVYAVPIGATVTVIKEYNKEWSEVRYKTSTGFMMSKFLTNPDSNETLLELKTKLQQALDLLDKLEA